MGTKVEKIDYFSVTSRATYLGKLNKCVARSWLLSCASSNANKNPAADDCGRIRGWGTGIRTPIGRARICSPTVRRYPTERGADASVGGWASRCGGDASAVAPGGGSGGVAVGLGEVGEGAGSGGVAVEVPGAGVVALGVAGAAVGDGDFAEAGVGPASVRVEGGQAVQEGRLVDGVAGLLGEAGA